VSKPNQKSRLGIVAFPKKPSDINGDDIIIGVSNFDECVEEGNLVMESYPPQCRSKTGEVFVQNIGNELEKSDLIGIETPRPNSKVESSFAIRGEARGTWFFEGDFSAKLMSNNGDLLCSNTNTNLAGSSFESTGNFLIASRNGVVDAGILYDGIIDDVRIYNSKLNNEQVAYIYDKNNKITSKTVGGVEFIRGDANDDEQVNLADPVYLLQFLFAQGNAPECRDAADANDDGTITIADAVYPLQFLFAQGPAIPQPYPGPGIDMTADKLFC